MQSKVLCEDARQAIGAAIGQRILKSEDPAKAFLQIFASEELSAWERGAPDVVGKQDKLCRARCGVSPAANSTTGIEVTGRLLP